MARLLLVHQMAAEAHGVRVVKRHQEVLGRARDLVAGLTLDPTSRQDESGIDVIADTTGSAALTRCESDPVGMAGVGIEARCGRHVCRRLDPDGSVIVAQQATRRRRERSPKTL